MSLSLNEKSTTDKKNLCGVQCLSALKNQALLSQTI